MDDDDGFYQRYLEKLCKFHCVLVREDLVRNLIVFDFFSLGKVIKFILLLVCYNYEDYLILRTISCFYNNSK